MLLVLTKIWNIFDPLHLSEKRWKRERRIFTATNQSVFEWIGYLHVFVNHRWIQSSAISFRPLIQLTRYCKMLTDHRMQKWCEWCTMYLCSTFKKWSKLAKNYCAQWPCQLVHVLCSLLYAILRPKHIAISMATDSMDRLDEKLKELFVLRYTYMRISFWYCCCCFVCTCSIIAYTVSGYCGNFSFMHYL